jgi:hypothetical protein
VAERFRHAEEQIVFFGVESHGEKY